MFRSLEAKELSFLQSLVNELGQQQEKQDSDNVNTGELKVNTSEKLNVFLNEETKEIKMELMKDKKRQEISVNMNHIKRREGDNIWSDFLTDEEIQGKNGQMKAKKDQLRENTVEHLEKEEKVAGNETHVLESDDCVDKEGDLRDQKQVGRKKKHKIKEVKHSFTSISAASNGSYNELICHGNNKSHFESMSEPPSENRERRLNRRRQLALQKCAGSAQSGNVLEQKIQELHALLVKPLTEPRQYMHQTRQELLRLFGISQQQAAQIMEEMQSQPNGFKRKAHQPVSAELTSENSDDGYSALRAAQIGWAKQRRPWTAVQQKPLPGQKIKQRPFSAIYHQDKKLEAKDRHHGLDFSDLQRRGQDVRKGRSDSCERMSSQNVIKREQEMKKNERKSSQGSPEREVQLSDTHWKNSSNPVLKKWLRKKNKDFRRQKAEECRRLKEERAKIEHAAGARQELFKDSDIKVKEWIAQKRKEARKNAKEKRRILVEEERMKHEKNRRSIFGAVRSFKLSLRTQTSNDKQFIPVIGPETDEGEPVYGREQNSHSDVPCTETDSPQLPVSKFVYRRPIYGQVRLMTQHNKIEHGKKSEHEKKSMKTNKEQDKPKKMRMSYDQWLLKKREENLTKQQEIEKQKALTKSDPELERIIPEIARRRIELMQQGKKRIETGINDINDEVNKSFGGSDFKAVPECRTLSDQSSNGLGVQEGIKQKQSTTKQSFSSKESVSTRRPMSASSYSQVHRNNENKRSSQPNPFKLPFPPQDGAPKYVLSKQKKLFSSDLTQDKISNMPDNPDQLSEVVKKKSDIRVETLPLTKSHEPDSLRHESVKSVTAEDGKSFFVTHGNLGNTSFDRHHGNNLLEIEEEGLEETDGSEKLQEEPNNE